MASLVSSLAGAPTPAARRALDFFAAAMPRMTLAGGKGHTLLAECPGALLQFFGTPAACALRLVCREFQAEVAAYPWEDRETVILGSIGGWRAFFRRSRAPFVCGGFGIRPLQKFSCVRRAIWCEWVAVTSI